MVRGERVSFVGRIVRSYEGVGAAILNKFSRLGYWPAVNLTACQPACGVCDIAIAVVVVDGDRAVRRGRRASLRGLRRRRAMLRDVCITVLS